MFEPLLCLKMGFPARLPVCGRQKNTILSKERIITSPTTDADLTTRRRPELLAPAGSMDAFKAALAAGADAVYLGLDRFNARRNADNLGLDDLRAACRMAHLGGRRVYLTVNTLVLSQELEEALEMVSEAWECGIDAAIVQDIGLLVEMRRRIPALEVHVSTQADIGDIAGVALARALGARRVTLARELSLAQIAQLASLGVDLEVFAHGALCVCASGQCLMSSLIGRRSANRGLCAQPCRLAWQLVDADGTEMALHCDQPGDHLLSPKDLCTIDLLPQLIDAGVASLKVEGRMKTPEYVAAVVGTYRAALDRAFDDPEGYAALPEEHALLAEAFSRGFTTAYLEGLRGNEMMGYQRPNNRGVQVGRVAGLADGLVELALDRDIVSGDVLEFWTSRGRHAQEVDTLIVDDVASKVCAAGGRARLIVRRPVAPGDRVFRVRSAEQDRSLRELLDGFVGVVRPLDFTVEAHIGAPLSITVTDPEGVSGSAEGRSCEAARTTALTTGQVIEHVGRLGNTPYTAGGWDIRLDEGVGLGFSQLHNVRRAAIDDLERHILERWEAQRTDDTPVLLPRTDDAVVVASEPTASHRLEVAAIAPDLDAADRLRAHGAAVVYVPALELLAADADRALGLGVIPILPTVVREHEREALVDLAVHLGHAVCDTPALVHLLAGRGVQVEAGIRCGLMNDAAADAIVALGAQRIWLSPELSLAQVRDLAAHVRVPLTMTVSGALELMVTEHCELMALGPCDERCEGCPRRRRAHGLRDAKGYVFPVRTDIHGRGHIYNSVELDVVPEVPELSGLGVGRFVVDATLMDAGHAAAVLARLVGTTLAPASAPSERLEGTTTGHLFRGVL